MSVNYHPLFLLAHDDVTTRAGKFVRFTSLSAKPTGPQPPMHLQERPPQGTVTDIKEGGLIVSFDEMWDFDDGLWQ